MIIKDGTKYWTKPETGIQWKGWAPPKDQAKAVDIETTAYALLSLGVQKDLEGGLPVLKWVTSQRNPEGGFSSTQVIEYWHTIGLLQLSNEILDTNPSTCTLFFIIFYFKIEFFFQDTIIALQSLAEFATMVYSPNFNMKVRLTSKTPGVPFQKDFTVDANNALVLQTADVRTPNKLVQLKPHV